MASHPQQPKPHPRFAADTNFVLDLAAELHWHTELVGFLRERGKSISITHTVVAELSSIETYGNAEERRLAGIAFDRILGAEIGVVDQTAIDRGIAFAFSERLRRTGVLPPAEVNDGVILAEASISGFQVLLSNDTHLRDADKALLERCFNEASLNPVLVVRVRDFRSLMR